MNITERFLKYVNIETTSNEESNTCPSTEIQLNLGKILVEELLSLGLKDASIDENGYVMATLESNIDKDVPVLGFISHMDTAPDVTTKNIKPRIVNKYDGGVIPLDTSANINLSPDEYPDLKDYIGQDIIVTDGHTLLGADDKAGIAEIMCAVETLVNTPSIKHGTIKIAFNPDEEIGRGADRFDVAKFGAKYAYTIDGGKIGELEYESFNAANLTITFNGKNIHPGSAKDKMVNSIEIAMELHRMLPEAQKPQYTSDYEGFFHLNNFSGNVDKSKSTYILRDHNRDLFEKRKKLIQEIVDFINKKYGENTAVLDMKDMYYNMKEKIEPVYFIVDIAKQAMEELGITPIIQPIRGGTDGSRLSFMGLPCPNIFTGGHNFHGRFEYIPVQSMEKAKDTILKVIDKYTNM